MKLKSFKVSSRVKGEMEDHEICMDGVLVSERLTPKLAIRAALVVFGHRCGITVSDTVTAYRVYAKSTRKLSVS